MPADPLSFNIACLPAVRFSICYTCLYGVSLSAVPAGMVMLHYRSGLLVGTSLSAMPVGVCLTIGHTFWGGASL